MTHIVVNGWFAGQVSAGSGQYLHHILANLVSAPTTPRVSLLVPAIERQAGGTLDLPTWLGVSVVTVRLPRLTRNLAKLWWEQIGVPRAARRLAADVLWVPYWAAPLWQPCPTVVTVHDLIPRLLPAYRGGLLQRIYTALVSLTARRARAVVTVSHASARDIVNHLHVPAERVHAVHHGAHHRHELVFNAALIADIRHKYGLPERYFLYLGGFDVRKNLWGTLSAYRSYLDQGGDRDVHLVIAGHLPAADSAFTPDPRRISANFGLGESVQFCGLVDEEDKPLLYALATAYLFPSLYEGFGFTVVEAMGAGTPVITSAD